MTTLSKKYIFLFESNVFVAFDLSSIMNTLSMVPFIIDCNKKCAVELKMPLIDERSSLFWVMIMRKSSITSTVDIAVDNPANTHWSFVPYSRYETLRNL
jgi:hypothetical protein